MISQKLLRTTLLSFFLIASISITAKAQQTVSASEIMEAVKKGEDVNYSNVTVTGVLDFTFMEEKEGDLPRRRSWWRGGGDNTVNEDIESRISFTNVTFQDHVIAYYHDKRTEYTFTADFEKEVTFKNCDFQRDAMFKYSTFERGASFSGAQFNGESTFKYAEFEEEGDFSNAFFDDDAIFKYTKFRSGASFNAAKFDRSLDMKYTKVRGDFDMKDMVVRWDMDTKYAEVNGRNLDRYKDR